MCVIPPVEVSMLGGFHKKAGIPLGAGNHHKEFSDPLFLKTKRTLLLKVVINQILWNKRQKVERA